MLGTSNSGKQMGNTECRIALIRMLPPSFRIFIPLIVALWNETIEGNPGSTRTALSLA